MGIDYFCIETDIKDDDKVFALRYHYATAGGGYDLGAGYAAFGRLVDVLADIYREGFAAEMNLPRRIRLSQQLGLSPDEFDGFIGECVNAGLFDRRLWEDHQVLTSRGIQRRYYIVANRRTGAIPESQKRWLLPDDDGPGDDPDGPGADDAASSEVERDKMSHDAASCTHDETSCDRMPPEAPDAKSSQAGHSATSCIHDADKMKHDAESCPLRKEKRREEKEKKTEREREEKETARDATGGGHQPADFEAIASSLSKRFGSGLSGRKDKHIQPYPLSCMSVASGAGRYDDGMGVEYDTPWDAIVQHLRYRAPDIDVGSFAQRVSATCPHNCPETPEHVSQCFRLISQTIDKYDRTKCASPIPLICKVLADDRKELAS